MSDREFGHAAGDPLPDRLKQYLTDMARRELDILRADLEVRLVALETALARPDQHESIETLVLDLARAATVEAEAAASRAMLAAQFDAEERTGTADARRDLETERAAANALRADIDQLRARMDGEVARLRAEHQDIAQKLAAAQRDLTAAQRDVKDARQNASARAAELASARDAAGAAQAEAAARVKTLEAKVKTLEGDKLEAERVRRDAVARADAAEVLARETVARASNAEAWGKDVETRLQDAQTRMRDADARVRDADARIRDAEARVNEAETRVRDADARVSEAEARIRDADGRGKEAEARIREADDRGRQAEARAHDADARISEAEARVHEAEARADAALEARNALAAEVAALKQTIARAQDGAASQAAAAAGNVHDFEQRLAAADERIRTLELQLFQRGRAEQERDEELSGQFTPKPSTPFQPTRSATRYSFGGGVNVEIDGHLCLLVDLSTSGAQVLAPVALDEGREAELRLMSDEIPASCRGRIVWTRLEPKSAPQALRHRAGMLFTQVDAGAVEAFIIRYAAT